MEDSNQIDEYTNSPIDIAIKCILGGIVVITYFIGIYLHMKLIKTSRLEKCMTWMIDIANSVFLLCQFGHLIIMYAVTYGVYNLHTYTGSWFCYTSKALTLILNAHVSGHTFIIAIMKYGIGNVIMVSHWKRKGPKNIFGHKHPLPSVFV